MWKYDMVVWYNAINRIHVTSNTNDTTEEKNIEENGMGGWRIVDIIYTHICV